MGDSDGGTEVSRSKKQRNLTDFSQAFRGSSSTKREGLAHVHCKTASSIMDTILTLLKEWRLDLSRFVSFGSDGASVMLGNNNEVGAPLKREANPFVLQLHCVAHRTNLTVLSAAKHPECKDLSTEIDNVVNAVCFYFKKSPKRKEGLLHLQKELFDFKRMLKRYQKVCWLSRSEAICSVCDSLEAVLVFLRDSPHSEDHGVGKALYNKLHSFKMVYVLHFLADILKSLAALSMVFQNVNVDVTSIGAIVNAEISNIRMTYLRERIDTNAFFMNEESGYHMIPDFGPDSGYLKGLSSQMRGNMFHSVELQRCRLGTDLEEAVSFQKNFAEAVANALKERFADNDLVSAFRILSPTQMPTQLVKLREWGQKELDSLCAHFGEPKVLKGESQPPLLRSAAVKTEFYSFKSHAVSEFGELSFSLASN
ncbi:hypothetical protein R1sor_015001 [Riccia sorocarpa]|uniref:DUF4371 domain-containing protein n=1 Tax=Riccia sorocarpa TaxID=122646 RepID=A0ABD3HDZ5_9MARC